MIQLICISIAIYARPGKDASLNNGIREGTSVDSQDITRFVSFQFSRINKINQHLFYNFFSISDIVLKLQLSSEQ